MKRIIITLLAFLPMFMAGQEFAVANFELREFDLTAINEATKFVDDNGENCALIKIETTEKGFFFDGGSIGIAKVDDNHTSEIWVYVPAGLRKITIMNNKFGVIRDYYFPITLVSARTYLMTLKFPNLAPDKRLEEKTDSMQQQIAEMQRMMNQLMQNQQQGGGQSTQATHSDLPAVPEEKVFESGMVSKNTSGSYAIPDGYTGIGVFAFEKCRYLTDVTIPNSVTTIGRWAFDGCNSLTQVIIPNTVTAIGSYAFEHSGISSIDIPNSTDKIGNCAFSYCSNLKSVKLPDNLTDIPSCLFRDCKSLTEVTIPNGVTAIGDFAFTGCISLTSLTIPDKVTIIKNGAFYNCKGLNSITFKARNTLIDEKNRTFFGCKNLQVIYVPKGSRSFYESQLPRKLHKLIVEQ